MYMYPTAKIVCGENKKYTEHAIVPLTNERSIFYLANIWCIDFRIITMYFGIIWKVINDRTPSLHVRRFPGMIPMWYFGQMFQIISL